jgi:hypothetical protein
VSLFKQNVIYPDIMTNMTISLSLQVATSDYGFQKIIGEIIAAPECSIPPPPLKPPDLQSPPSLPKIPPDRHVATCIHHATTFLQRHKGNYYIFQIKPSLCFTQWDPGVWSLILRRSQQAWELFIIVRTRGRVLQRWRRLM